MIVFPEMLIPAAKATDMKVPDELDDSCLDDIKQDYPHFWVFCQIQLCRRMLNWSEHWDNAKVIAAIPEERLKAMTVADFISAGVVGLTA